MTAWDCGGRGRAGSGGSFGRHQARVVSRQAFGARQVVAMALAADRGVFACPRASGGHHLDAIDRTGRHAQVATRAPVVQHRMHVLVRADDGVDRTGLDAQRTADAMRFVDARDQQRAGFAARQIQRKQGRAEQRG